MQFNIPQRIFGLLIVSALLVVCSRTGFAQTNCLTGDDVNRFVAQINTQQSSQLNPKLRDALLKLKLESESAFGQIVAKNRKDEVPAKLISKQKEKINLRLC